MDTSAPTTPLELDLDRRTRLRVRWGDGHASEFPLALLRRGCPCATCRSERGEREKTRLPIVAVRPAAEMATVETAELVGNYAIRIVWKDGHNTGIFDYRLLRSMCPCPDCTAVVTARGPNE